jgi:hypothetical protein
MYDSDMAMPPWFSTDQGHYPAYKSPILNKFHQHKGLLSPVNAPSSLDPSALLGQSPIGGMSSLVMEPLGARFGATLGKVDWRFHGEELITKHPMTDW